jgi:hypothetical protein
MMIEFSFESCEHAVEVNSHTGLMTRIVPACKNARAGRKHGVEKLDGLIDFTGGAGTAYRLPSTDCCHRCKYHSERSKVEEERLDTILREDREADDTAWRTAGVIGTKEAYKEYLLLWGGQHEVDARNALAKLAYEDYYGVKPEYTGADQILKHLREELCRDMSNRRLRQCYLDARTPKWAARDRTLPYLLFPLPVMVLGGPAMGLAIEFGTRTMLRHAFAASGESTFWLAINMVIGLFVGLGCLGMALRSVASDDKQWPEYKSGFIMGFVWWVVLLGRFIAGWVTEGVAWYRGCLWILGLWSLGTLACTVPLVGLGALPIFWAARRADLGPLPLAAHLRTHRAARRAYLEDRPAKGKEMPAGRT